MRQDQTKMVKGGGGEERCNFGLILKVKMPGFAKRSDTGLEK